MYVIAGNFINSTTYDSTGLFRLICRVCEARTEVQRRHSSFRDVKISYSSASYVSVSIMAKTLTVRLPRPKNAIIHDIDSVVMRIREKPQLPSIVVTALAYVLVEMFCFAPDPRQRLSEKISLQAFLKHSADKNGTLPQRRVEAAKNHTEGITVLCLSFLDEDMKKKAVALWEGVNNQRLAVRAVQNRKKRELKSLSKAESDHRELTRWQATDTKMIASLEASVERRREKLKEKFQEVAALQVEVEQVKQELAPRVADLARLYEGAEQFWAEEE